MHLIKTNYTSKSNVGDIGFRAHMLFYYKLNTSF